MNAKSPSHAVAVIGAGYWGRNIVRNLHALGALAAVCDRNPEHRAAVTTQYPAIPAFADAQEVMTEPTVQAVAIATPSFTHGMLVKQALAAGKDVFVEKPFCLDAGEAERLKAQAEASGRVLMVGHLLLYHPAFVALRGLVAGGALGRLRYIYSNRLNLGKILREENALWSFAPHDISMILQLAGRPPLRVSAYGGQYLSKGVADTTLSHLDFGDGLQAHIFVSWLHPYKDHRLVVVGERAMVAFNDVAPGPDKLLLYRHQAHWDGDLPVVDRAEAEPVPYEDVEPLRRECEAFLAALRREATPPSDAAEGIRVMKVLDACQQALRSSAPVTLPVAAE